MNTKDKIATHITNKTQVSSVLNTKVGEIMTEVLNHTRTQGLTLEIKSKGFNQDGDIQNSLFDIEPGDIVYGWLDADTYLPESMYLAVNPADLTDKDNYSQGISTDYSEVRATQVQWP